MPRRHNHRKVEKRIERLFTEGLNGKATRHLWKALRQCPSCAQLYEQYSKMEAVLTKSVDNVSVFSVERTRNAVLTRHFATPPPLKSRWFKRLLPIVAALGAILTILLFFLKGADSHRVSLAHISTADMREPSPRGETRSSVSYAGFRIFAVSPQDQNVREGSGLNIEDIITFTYTWTRDGSGYLILFGLQEDVDGPLWYYPDGGQGHSVRIAGNRVDEPLGDGIRLNVNHHPGLLRIVSLFSKNPIDVHSINVAVEKLRQHGNLMDPGTPIRLDMFQGDVIEFSALFKVRLGSDTGNGD